MSTTLTNGIIIPDNGSRNWGGDLANNWNILDVHVGYMTDLKNRVTTLETGMAENTANIQTNASNISALQTSKQDVIEDLETIRTGASAGATAVQPSTLNNYLSLNGGEITGNLTVNSTSDGWKPGLEWNYNNERYAYIHAFTDQAKGQKSLYIQADGEIYLASTKLTFNGINPGALSLPNPSPSAFISKSLPSSGGTITADIDCWFEIRTKATSSNALIQLFVAGGSSSYAKNAGDTLIISVPMRAGVEATIFYRDIETPTVCRLVSCMGNV